MKNNNKNLRLMILAQFNSQKNFSKVTGLHQTSVSQILTGKRQLKLSEAWAWIRLLGCDWADLDSILERPAPNVLIRGDKNVLTMISRKENNNGETKRQNNIGKASRTII